MANIWKNPHYHRHNPNNSFDSICLICFVTIARARHEVELVELERDHVCESAFLAERGMLTPRWIN
jgi:hypothetical protein